MCFEIIDLLFELKEFGIKWPTKSQKHPKPDQTRQKKFDRNLSLIQVPLWNGFTWSHENFYLVTDGLTFL